MVHAVDFPENLPWINTTEPLTIEKLKGHVILLDFWTYCCINCIHVIEDLKWLEEKYKDQPFVVVGIHSAKFDNEKDEANIRSAVARYNVRHPVLVDNDHIMWDTYGISAWPSFILIDTEGNVIGKASGEGIRDALDREIGKALEKGRKAGTIANKKIEIILDNWKESLLSFPGKIDIDPKNKHLFISDSNHNRILQVQLEEGDKGRILSVIGSGKEGLEDGSFEETAFNKPQGVVYRDKKVYVADTGNHAIREIDLKNKTVKTIAGKGVQGYIRQYSGEAKQVALNSPWDLALDDQCLYIAMAGNHQIWRMELKSGIIENFVGSGAEGIVDDKVYMAALAQPSGLAIGKGRLYFADSEASALRYVDLETEEVKTLVGKGLFIFGRLNGDFENALLQHPLGLDVVGDKVYIADTYNHAIRVAELAKRQLKTIIYQPAKGVCHIDDKECDVLALYEPNDVVYFEGKLYITDTNNHLIRIFYLDSRELKDLVIH
jgi:thiol-disulfide isomerase/thioredoxin